jgi:hypothetical protein
LKTDAQLRESIERFQRVFWDKQPAGRPPVGIVNTDVYLPAKYLRQPFPRAYVEPTDLRPEMVRNDYEFAFANRPVNGDDWMPFAAPWRAIPWLEAWCGCPVRYSSAALAPAPIHETIDQLAAAALPAREAWFACLREQTVHLAAAVPNDCWISPTILRGCADVMAALRGLDGFCLDLHDAPALVAQVAARLNPLLLRALEQHFALVKPKHGGYGHIFGYWAPGPTVAIQEDVLGLCRPEVYRDLFMPHNAAVVRQLGPHILFHLHSTGFQHYRHVLDIPGLAGLQMTLEANGPPLAQLVPVFRTVLERSRLALFADHRFEELAAVLRQLPVEGLYVVVPQSCITSEAQFADFITSVWPRRG